MKFTCEKAALVSAISLASRTVAPKNAIAVLEGIHVKAGHHLIFTGYNLETGISVRTAADIIESGECVFPAQLIGNIVRKMPDDIVSVSVDEHFKVSIRGGVSSFTLTAMDAEDYPELPDVESDKGIHIPRRELREMINGTIFSASTNQARPIHTGCLFEVTDDSISMVAIDGFRLARRTYHAVEPIGRTLKFVVPAAALRELEKILDDTNENAVFMLGRKHILFQSGDSTLVCRILEGEFLDWRRVVPTENPIKLAANVSQLQTSLERMDLINNDKVKSPVHCKFSHNEADFQLVSTIGSAHDRCPVAGDGKELEIGFNCRYLLDALRVIPTDEVMMELSNNLSPIVMTPCDTSYDFAYMVLPVRLNRE